MDAQPRLFAASQGPVPDLSRQEAARALLKIRENWKSAIWESWGKAANSLCICVTTLHETPLLDLGQGNYFNWI